MDNKTNQYHHDYTFPAGMFLLLLSLSLFIIFSPCNAAENALLFQQTSCVRFIQLSNQTTLFLGVGNNATSTELYGVDAISLIVARNKTSGCAVFGNFSVDVLRTGSIGNAVRDWKFVTKTFDTEKTAKTDETRILVLFLPSGDDALTGQNYTIPLCLTNETGAIIQEENHTVTLISSVNDTRTPIDAEFMPYLSDTGGELLAVQLTVKEIENISSLLPDGLNVSILKSDDESGITIVYAGKLQPGLKAGSVVKVTGVVRPGQFIIARSIEEVRIPIFITVTAVIAIASMLILVLLSAGSSRPPYAGP